MDVVIENDSVFNFVFCLDIFGGVGDIIENVVVFVCVVEGVMCFVGKIYSVFIICCDKMSGFDCCVGGMFWLFD